MPKVALYNQDALASPAVGTPGVDTSGQQIGHDIAAGANALGADIASMKQAHEVQQRELLAAQAAVNKEADDIQQTSTIDTIVGQHKVQVNGVLEHSKAQNLTTPGAVIADVQNAAPQADADAIAAFQQARPTDASGLAKLKGRLAANNTDMQIGAQTFGFSQTEAVNKANLEAQSKNAIAMAGQIALAVVPKKPDGSLDFAARDRQMLAAMNQHQMESSGTAAKTLTPDQQTAYYNTTQEGMAKAALAADAGAATDNTALLDHDMQVLKPFINPVDWEKFHHDIYAQAQQAIAAKHQADTLQSIQTTTQFYTEGAALHANPNATQADYNAFSAKWKNFIGPGGITPGTFNMGLTAGVTKTKTVQKQGDEHALGVALNSANEAAVYASQNLSMGALLRKLQSSDPNAGTKVLKEIHDTLGALHQRNEAYKTSPANVKGLDNTAAVTQIAKINASLAGVTSAHGLQPAMNKLLDFDSAMGRPAFDPHPDINAWAQVQYSHITLNSYTAWVNAGKDPNTPAGIQAIRDGAAKQVQRLIQDKNWKFHSD